MDDHLLTRVFVISAASFDNVEETPLRNFFGLLEALFLYDSALNIVCCVSFQSRDEQSEN